MLLQLPYVECVGVRNFANPKIGQVKSDLAAQEARNEIKQALLVPKKLYGFQLQVRCCNRKNTRSTKKHWRLTGCWLVICWSMSYGLPRHWRAKALWRDIISKRKGSCFKHNVFGASGVFQSFQGFLTEGKTQIWSPDVIIHVVRGSMIGWDTPNAAVPTKSGKA